MVVGRTTAAVRRARIVEVGLEDGSSDVAFDEPSAKVYELYGLHARDVLRERRAADREHVRGRRRVLRVRAERALVAGRHEVEDAGMVEAGLGVVIATDFNPGSSPTPSMPMILSLACTQMKMSPAEAISASTINAAYSLGRGDQIGSLERGKFANFAIFDCEDYRELAYWFGVPLTHGVYVKGKKVY